MSAKKLDCGHFHIVRLVVSADFWALAVSEARKQPLIGGPEGWINALMNTALLAEEVRIEEALIRKERIAGTYSPTPSDFDDDIPF